MTMYTESLRAFLKPVLPYLDDESVSEILINAPDDVWIERKGRLYKTEARFSGEEALVGAARNMAQFVGRLISEERPRLDARLPDGSRIHVVLPPIARKGVTISIRKFFKDKLSFDGMVKLGSINTSMMRVIEAMVRLKLNAIVSGGTGSGKTTLLNVLSRLIPDDERILTIEDSAELQLTQTHLVSFESRPPDKYGKNGIDMGDLLHSALRLRPDRIIVGEVRGGECFHLMQAMNTGHGGSLSTCHANTPTDTLRRLESLCLMSAVEMPLVAVRAQVASAINMIVCTSRLYDGTRKLTHISEVLPLNDRGEYRTQDIWVFTPVGKDEQGGVLGYFAPTGILPSWLGKARAYGFEDLDDSFFDPATYGVPPPPLYNLGEDYTLRWAPSLKHREKGIPDPDDYKQQLRALEHKLKEEAERDFEEFTRQTLSDAKKVAPAPAPMAARVKQSPASAAARPTPASAPSVSDDKTPPPTRNPLVAQAPAPREMEHEDEEDPAEPEPIAPAPRNQMKTTSEPLVQVADDLLSEASELVAKEVTQPPRRAPLPPANRAAKAAPPKKGGRDDAPAPVDPDKTHIKPMPEKPRR